MRILFVSGGTSVMSSSVIEFEAGDLVFVEGGREVARHPADSIRSIDLSAESSDVATGAARASQPDRAYSVDEIRKTYPNAYAKWTSADERALIAMDAAGMTAEDIGSALGRQPGGIRSRLDRLRDEGLPAAVPPARVRFD